MAPIDRYLQLRNLRTANPNEYYRCEKGVQYGWIVRPLDLPSDASKCNGSGTPSAAPHHLCLTIRSSQTGCPCIITPHPLGACPTHRLLMRDTEEVLPYIYTPTVGEACER